MMIRSRLLTLLVVILPGLFSPLLAATPEQAAQLERQIEQLSQEEGTPSPLRDLYQRTLGAIKDQQQYQQRAEALQRQLERQPIALEEQRRQLERPLPATDMKALRALDAATLEQRLTLKRAEQLQLEQRRDRLLQQIELNEQKLVSLRGQLAELKQTTPRVPELPGEGDRQLTDARLQLQNALQELYNSQIQALELELLALPGESERARLELRHLQRLLSAGSEQLTQMQQLLEQKRQDELQTTLNNLIQAGAQATQPGPIRELIERNRTLTEQLGQLNELSAATTRNRNALEQELNLVTQSLKTVQQQLELESYNASYELRRFTQSLSRPVDTLSTRQKLNALRLDSLDFNRLHAHRDPPTGAEAAALSATQRQQLAQLQASQERLLNQIQERREQLIGELSQLLTVQEQLNERITQARELVARQLLWLPVAPPISDAWPGQVLSSFGLLSQRLEAMLQTPLWNPGPPLRLSMILFALSTLLALWLYRYQRRHRARWARDLGNVIHDRFFHTLGLCLLAPLIAAPLPLLLMLLRQYSLDPAHPDYAALRQLLLFWAASLLLYGTLLLWLREPDGLFCAHFATPKVLAKRFKRQLHLLFWLGTPLLSIWLLIDSYNTPALQAGLGRLIFLLLTLTLALFWHGIWRVSHEVNQMTRGSSWWQSAHLWIVLLVLFNIAMFLLGVWGYTLTALFFMLILLVVVLQVLGAFLVFKLGLRWLLIAERRLAFSRAKARRAELVAARENNEESSPPLKENYLDLQTISDQSRILLKSFTLLLFSIMLWLTLGDFLPTLQVLESVRLWSSFSQQGAEQVITYVTLRDLILGLLVLWISFMAAQNLPGLLELLALRHLDLTPGSSYAITTLLRYSLILIGVLVAISQFGLEWGKLQWLIAALGVGLGFGLQEIVANFVSGLIILFEKPVRIGDTVTLGEVTGTVSRIQIRATTITDWDRKEVVIPNKTFITNQLINWSLSDAITRVVFTVGVAYGSDTGLAERLLLEVAHDNPRVLPDPEPRAYFKAFADSSLLIDLWVYVSTLADRIPVTDELNRAINDSFRQHGIEIAFPQLDVHLHRVKPPPKAEAG
jgi:potassium efflux system protein